MVQALCYSAIVASIVLWALGAPARAQDPDHIRGQITKVESAAIVMKTSDGKTKRFEILGNLTVIGLSRDSFTKVDFGTYVGSVAVKMNEYSPIVRDSMSWLHKGFELRVISEELRGIAVGHKEWDLTPETIIAHGWVDDIEGRVLSIKYGPTEEEETDVDVGRDIPILNMSLADTSLITLGAYVFVGAQKIENGEFQMVFILVGEDGIIPPM